MNKRRITSLTMLISFTLCILTSVILYIVPHGRIAYWSDWKLWGLTKTQWSDLHLNLGILFLLAGFFHIYFNWKPIIAYLKSRAKKLIIFNIEFNIAFALTIAVTVGTLLNIPPMSTILNIGESIKNSAVTKYGEPPYGHAELSSLKMFCKKLNLDLDTSVNLLKNSLIFENEKQSILEISKANNISPKGVLEIIKPAKIKVMDKSVKVMPDTPPPGFGRAIFSAFCSEFSLHEKHTLEYLQHMGVSAEPGSTIKKIASDNKIEPMQIFELIRESVK